NRTPERGSIAEIINKGDTLVADSIPDIIFHNGRITTLDRGNPTATALAIKDGKFLAVGPDSEILAMAGSGVRLVDLKRRQVLPGLVDNHTHVVRGGLNYNLEL